MFVTKISPPNFAKCKLRRFPTQKSISRKKLQLFPKIMFSPKTKVLLNMTLPRNVQIKLGGNPWKSRGLGGKSTSSKKIFDPITTIRAREIE